jgi:hypothetical protein
VLDLALSAQNVLLTFYSSKETASQNAQEVHSTKTLNAKHVEATAIIVTKILVTHVNLTRCSTKKVLNASLLALTRPSTFKQAQTLLIPALTVTQAADHAWEPHLKIVLIAFLANSFTQIS